MCAQTNPTYNPWPCVRDADYFSDDSSTSIIPSLDPVDGEPVTSNPGSPPASQDHALPAQIQIPVAVTSSAPISLSHTNRFLMPSAKSSKALRKHREDPHWAPRPANAFIIFRCDFSRKYSCEQTDQDGQVTTQNKSLSQRAADAWRSLPQESRNYYKQLAEKEKHRHALQHPYYRFRPMRRKASATKKQFLQHPYSGTGPVQPLLSSDPHPASAPRSSSNTSRIDDSRGAPLDSQALGGHPAGMVRQRVPSAPQHNMLSVSHIVPSDRHPRRPRSFSAGIDVMRQPAYVMHSLPPLPCPPHGAQPHPHSPQQVQLQSTYGESLKSESSSHRFDFYPPPPPYSPPRYSSPQPDARFDVFDGADYLASGASVPVPVPTSHAGSSTAPVPTRLSSSLSGWDGRFGQLSLRSPSVSSYEATPTSLPSILSSSSPPSPSVNLSLSPLGQSYDLVQHFERAQSTHGSTAMSATSTMEEMTETGIGLDLDLDLGLEPDEGRAYTVGFKDTLLYPSALPHLPAHPALFSDLEEFSPFYEKQPLGADVGTGLGLGMRGIGSSIGEMAWQIGV